MSKTTVIDGGFSTQLSTHIKDKIDGDPLWTARYLATNPDAVFATHLDFLRAGADVIQTNTYQASIDGFTKYLGMTKEESFRLIHDAVNCAKKAVDVYLKETKEDQNNDHKPLIAGSCGPYGAALHDGSEYTGAYATSISCETYMDWHRPRINALVESGVDMLALETIPCQSEAKALIHLLREFPNTKAWLSFSCREDGKSIVDGSSFQEVAISCFKKAQYGQVLAVGVNCIAPQCSTSLLKNINKNLSKEFVPLILYPNSGEKYTIEDGWKREGKCYTLDQFIDEWLDLGVRYIGGCCRTYAADVQRIRVKVDEWNAKQKKG